MKIFYIFSKEDSLTLINETWKSCLDIFPGAEKILGKDTIIDSYYMMSELSPNDLFVWIDGDNTVLPAARNVLTVTEPSIFMATNKFNIVYGHGGIKVCRPHMNVRQNAIDVSWYLGFTPINIVASIHHLGTDWIEYRGIFVEMVKNALMGDDYILDQWKEKVPDIWIQVEHLLNTEKINFIVDIIRHREKFKDYYENCLRRNM
jgi:hypothetical protein